MLVIASVKLTCSYNFLVQVLVALGRSEWLSKVVVSATVTVGFTPAVMVAKPVPA